MAVARSNPFVYGRVLGLQDAACERLELERAIEATVRDRGRLALVGDRRLGKSTLVERTLAARRQPLLRWDFHRVYSVEDAVHRAAERLESYVRGLSPVARRVTPWLREIGVGLESIRVSYQGAEAALRVGPPTDHFARVLGFVEQLARRRSFSLFVDELQDLHDCLPEREGDAVLGLLRSELQRLRIPCFFAGSSRDSFRSLFTSDGSPFYASARLLEVAPIPTDDMRAFLVQQFARTGFTLGATTADTLLALAGDSPNDVQHLAHETWNAARPPRVARAELAFALRKILADLTPMAEAWLAQLSVRQQRALMATAFHEDLGAGTAAFLAAAGVVNNGAIASALRPCIEAREPIVEKVGSRYRIRSRYLRLWLVTRTLVVPALMPALRVPAEYRGALEAVCRDLPPLLEGRLLDAR